MEYGYNDEVLVCYDFWKGTHATFRMWMLEQDGRDCKTTTEGD